jgi:hypothetical protein
MPPVTETSVPVLDPLSAEERAKFNEYLARDSASKGPAARIGDPYVALTWLSVPRRGDKDRQTDLVPPGETVYLTEEEARQYQRHDPGRDGRATAVIRKLSGPDGTREALPARVVPNGAFLLPRHLSGRLFRPMQPPPGSEGPRPDPEGSSRIQVMQDGNAPEAAGSMVPEPGEMDDNLRAAPVLDAVDIPPKSARSRGSR